MIFESHIFQKTAVPPNVFFSFIPTVDVVASKDSSRFLNLLASNFSSKLCEGVFCVVHGNSRLVINQ